MEAYSLGDNGSTVSTYYGLASSGSADQLPGDVQRLKLRAAFSRLLPFSTSFPRPMEHRGARLLLLFSVFALRNIY